MSVALVVGLLLACSADPDAPSADDTGTDPLVIPDDNLATALGDCLGVQREPDAYPNQLFAGDELQRYTLRDPRAVCNDGSPAVLYVRGYTDDSLADVWSIHLQGGGGCSSYASCALRWCGLQYYDRSKMSSVDLPLEIAGFGVFDAGASNALAGANQVYFYYCSSDSWAGQGTATYSPDDLELPTDSKVELPDGLPTYTMFRHGHHIVEAGLDELADGLVADGGEELPPLDDAGIVLFNGTSAGSAGARTHADRVAERLGAGGAQVVAVFDANNTPPGELGPATYASELEAREALRWEQLLATNDAPPFMDESCLSHLGGTDDEHLCHDLQYLSLNHITTPFFVRQDLRDVSEAAEATSISEDEHEAAVVAYLEALTRVPEEAVEAAAITHRPGVYGPNCAQHIGMEMTDWWVVGKVADGAGTDWSFQAGVVAWYQGAADAGFAVVDDPRDGPGDGPRSTCAEVDEEH